MSRSPLFSRTISSPLPAFRLFLLLLGSAAIFPAISASAEESLIALGRVSVTGNLDNSANTVGGNVVVNKGPIGEYEIEITAPGAFNLDHPNDFAISITMDNIISDDEAAVAVVGSLNADVLSIVVHTSDVEDSSDLSLPEARDAAFHFQVYRIPENEPLDPSSRYFVASATVSTGGGIFGGIGLHGAEITGEMPSAGNYQITVRAPGRFVGDAPADYVLSATVVGGSPIDRVIRGDVINTASDDEIVINVRVDDPQDDSNNSSADPTQNSFDFTIFRIPQGPEPVTPASRVLLAVAHVDGETGVLRTGASVFSPSFITADREGEGEYLVTLFAQGRFVGVANNDLVSHVTCRHNAFDDISPNSTVFIEDSNTLKVALRTNDVEEAGVNGPTARDRDFFVFVFGNIGAYRPDLQIAKRQTDNAIRGNDLYSQSGAGQEVRLRIRGSRSAKYFLAAENDGNLIDTPVIRRRGKFRGVRPKFFILTGGRQNVTAQVKGPGFRVVDLAPGETVAIQGKIRFKRTYSRRSTKIRVEIRSSILAQLIDVNQLKVKRRL